MEPAPTTCSSSSSSSEALCCKIFNFKKKDLVKSGFYRTKHFENIVCCGCGWESGPRKLSLKHINFVHSLSNPDCEMSDKFDFDFNKYLKSKQEVREMENCMRDTFLAYPKTYPDVERMVQAGFYYTGMEDAVTCVSCGVMLDEWNPNEDPLEEHKKASPFCELL